MNKPKEMKDSMPKSQLIQMQMSRTQVGVQDAQDGPPTKHLGRYLHFPSYPESS